jgi:signal peptidase I
VTDLAFPPELPKPRRISPALVVGIVVALLGLGVAVAGVGTGFLSYRAYRAYRAYWVPGPAMNPALKPGGEAVVRARDGGEVHRGDVVVFDRGAFAHPDSAGLGVFRVVADEYAHDAAAAMPYLVRMHEGQVFLLGCTPRCAGGCSAAPSCSSPASSG